MSHRHMKPRDKTKTKHSQVLGPQADHGCPTKHQFQVIWSLNNGSRYDIRAKVTFTKKKKKKEKASI